MYNKLFTKILDSSIWLEPTSTRIVWLTMIAAMDEEGFVQFASLANLAHRAIVPIGEAEKAVEILEGPDPNSSDPENEGRRIERVPGGWVVLNSQKYRQMATRVVIQEQTRERVRRHREKKSACNAPVTQGNEKLTPSDTDTDSEAKKNHPPHKPIPRKRGEGDGGKRLPTTEIPIRLSKLFCRKLTTEWSEKEYAAYKKIGTIDSNDLTLIEDYYEAERAKGTDGRHRRDLQTFLNNFHGELDRARAKSEGNGNGGDGMFTSR